jgi:EAL domain-containing protein (putative c-di-GMP-specific phosphodiesterase class I)
MLNDKFSETNVRSKLALAKNFNINVIAEEVESTQVYQRLKTRLLCGPSLFFSKPVAAQIVLCLVMALSQAIF